MHNTVDWAGGTLITIGLVMLVFALSEGNVVGWSTPWVPSLIVLSLLVIVAFGYWQHYLETKTQRRPLMKMSMFKNSKFLWANVLMALFFSSFNNFLVYATYVTLCWAPCWSHKLILRVGTGSKTTKACRSSRRRFGSYQLV
jgi:hypothetical protein